MATEEKRIGITDIPCSDESQDMLDMVKYVNGLETFIKNCPTPMSIAIQGDWGTGKTSVIHMLRNRLDPKDKSGAAKKSDTNHNVKCVYFNTWQYSQFNMADDLYISFVNTLVHKCFPPSEKASEKVSGFLYKLGTAMLFNMAKDKTGLDINEIFKQQKERIESIENLKDEFGDLVKNAIDDAKASKLVVFIDDLDRLNPEVAVELLEVIKLFMDVENCVFVLAIDYDVVVSGVRRKYGQNVSEEKCRSFFDKIIQLPFRLPVESYQLQELLRETVSYDIDDDDIEPLANFVNDFIGFNPRAYKRLANSFFLIKNVNEELQKAKDQKSDNESSQKTRNVLIFGSLCIQMCTPEFYQLLISVSDETEFKSLRDVADIEALDKYLINQDIDLELDEKKKKNLLRCLKSFNEFLSDIQHNDTSESNIYNHLTSVLRMTAITSVTVADEQKERAKSIKIDQLFINGKEEKATTPTEAITKVFDQLLNDNRNLVDDYLEKNKTLLTVDKSKSESLFRNKKELFEHEGKMIYIGVSSGTDSKTKAICKLCNFLKNYGKEAHVIWKYQGESVFDSDIPIK